MINGNLIYLTAVEADDLGKLLDWRNNPAFRKYFREFRELSVSQHFKWYLKSQELNPTTEYPFSIRLIHNDELIGFISINNINWINRNGQISLYIGKDLLYIDSFGWAKEAIELLHVFVFETLNLTKLFVELYANDKLKLELFKDLGFTQEARLKNHIFKDGVVMDAYIYSYFR